MAVEKSFVIFGGDIVEIVVSSDTTNGQYSILTEIAQPQVGPPPHIHTLEDEFLMPIYGTFEIFDGKNWSPMPAEGCHTARGTLHTWRNAGTEPGKLLVMATGNSFDVFLEKLVPLDLPRDIKLLIDISAEHGISYLMPSAPAEAAQELAKAAA